MKKLTIDDIQRYIDEIYHGEYKILDDVYTGANEPIKIKHIPCGVITHKTYNHLKRGFPCGVCRGNKIVKGHNDLSTLRPDVAIMAADIKDTYNVGIRSEKRINFVCPTCKELILKGVKYVCEHGLNCPRCSDGMSFPNKVMYNMLKNLRIPFINEFQPDWLDKFMAYDFYIPMFSLIIEMDGGLGHGRDSFHSKQDVDGLKRDMYKDRLAVEHGLQVIRINCDYHHDDRFTFIKNNILTSNLIMLVECDKVDWNLVFEQSQKNVWVDIINDFKSGLNTNELANKYDRSPNTIRSYLKMAYKSNLIDDVKFKMDYNQVIKVVCQYDLEGNFIAEYPSAMEAMRSTSADHTRIAECCKGKTKTVNGYQWRYYNGTYKNIEPVRKNATKAIEQYDLNGKYIQTFLSFKDAVATVTCSHDYIRDCCKGKRKSAGGYIWRYAQN